jgi:heterotetrameric sarcosine oxidase gamma subunit
MRDRAAEAFTVVEEAPRLWVLKSLCRNTKDLEWNGIPVNSPVGTVHVGPPRALSISPCEWLLIDMRAPGTLPPAWGVLVDCTAGYARFALRGAAVRDVFARGCGLDFDSFAANTCARTRLANLAVVLDCRTAEGRFDLYFPRSYASYLRGYLEDAAADWTSHANPEDLPAVFFGLGANL